MKKPLLPGVSKFLIFSVIIVSCSKSDDTPKRIQDLRGTTWVSDKPYNGHSSPYAKLVFMPGGDYYSGADGIFNFTDKSGGFIGLSSFTWRLIQPEGQKYRTTLVITYKDLNGVARSDTGAWVIGTLNINGVGYTQVDDGN